MKILALFLALAAPAAAAPVQSAYVKASNTNGGDRFGRAVAISGDTMVIGADFEDSAATGINGNQADNSAQAAGAAYVFRLVNGAWVQEAYLKASNAESGDAFGTAVAIDGDTIVVGAREESGGSAGVNGNEADNSLTGAGAAYVFTRTAGVWSQQAYLKASTPDAGDFFGGNVAISGDTIVVSAATEDSNATTINGDESNNSAPSAGAVYVFTRTAGMWSQQAYLKAANAESGDSFGTSVGISGDFVVVGAHLEDGAGSTINGNAGDNSASNAGAAYVFSRNAGVWTQEAYLKASNAETNDAFGISAAIDGSTIVVGASGEDSGSRAVGAGQSDNSIGSAGAAYVFVRTSGQWSQQAYLKSSNSDISDGFGRMVAVLGNTILVSALGESSKSAGINGVQSDNSAGSAGAVYAFGFSGSRWVQTAYVKASNPAFADNFGISLGLGVNRAVIGSFLEDGGSTGINGNQSLRTATDAGAAYVFDGSFGVIAPPALSSLAKTNADAPGAADIAFSTLSDASLNVGDATLWSTKLTGSGAPASRNVAMFATAFGSSDPDLVLQAGTSVGGLVVTPSNATVNAVSAPILNQLNRGLLQCTFTGTGVNAANNRILMLDDGSNVNVVIRTGAANTSLASAKLSALSDVVQSHTRDLIGVSYTLSASGTPLVSSVNDSGLLLIKHDGSAINTAARENDAAFGGGGFFGQFTGRAAVARTDTVHFGAIFKPTSGTPAAALFSVNEGNTASTRVALAGTTAPGAGTAKFASFPACTGNGSTILFKGTLSGALSTNNEGLWRGTTLVLRKGDDVDSTNLPGVRFSTLTKFWPVLDDQVVVQCTLTGTGVASTNNQALILRKADNTNLVLIRTGNPVPGIALPAKLLAISAVDVNPVSGSYAVLGTLSGVASSSNQALWTGNTQQINDPARLPVLRLRKGDLYSTRNTPLSTLKGLTLKPAADASGAGGRGLGQVVGVSGHVLLGIVGDRSLSELVVLNP